MNLTDAIAWTLLHFLWQGALTALALAVTLFLLKRARAVIRYAAGCGAMVVMLACPAATFLELRREPAPVSWAAPQAAVQEDFVNVSPRGSVPEPGPAPVNYLPAVVWAWFGGVVTLSIRMVGGWAVAERLTRRQTTGAGEKWEERCATLARRLGIYRPVKIVASALAQVPAVVGWIRPVVIVPVNVLTGLTTDQIEALLAHELAHIRRHDYLVNLAQAAAETLFFYHPAVWWVSRTIRNERENCCDDLAVEICGDRLCYVRALTQLEQLRSTPRLAMAADGGSLVNRVQRLLNSNAGTAGSSGVVSTVAITGCLLAAGVAVNGMTQRRASTLEIGLPAAEAPAAAKDAAPAPLTARATPSRAPRVRAPRPARESVEAPAEQQAAAPAAAEKPSEKPSWLDEIQAAGYKGVDVDQLISMKIHGVTADYIRQMRAAGFELSAQQLVSFRINRVTVEFINELKRAGFNVTADELVSLRVHGATPEFIREAKRQYPGIGLQQLIELKRLGIINL